jgi:hypothetical protein
VAPNAQPETIQDALCGLCQPSGTELVRRQDGSRPRRRPQPPLERGKDECSPVHHTADQGGSMRRHTDTPSQLRRLQRHHGHGQSVPAS